MKSILFSTPMVQAILDGRKTQTRRIIKAPVMRNVREPDSVLFDGKACKFRWFGDDVIGGFGIMPKYQPDDNLWVRETTYLYGRWQRNGFTKTGKQKYKFVWDKSKPVIYAANGKPDDICTGKDEVGYFKRPSIFMPREAARIFLRVTNVRVERLQDITEEDAIKEGTPYEICGGWHPTFNDPDSGGHEPDFINGFSKLWNSIYAAPKAIKNRDGEIMYYESYPWEDIQETREHKGKPWYVHGNPWIWVYEFERVSKIDQN